MRKLIIAIIITLSTTQSYAQKAAKAVYVELGGPGLASVNYDMRFQKKENGFGFLVGIGGYKVSDNSSGTSLLTIPLGLNYIVSKDSRNYFEVGAGYTYIHSNFTDNSFPQDNQNFTTSFGHLSIGYRLAPAKGGFLFRAAITPVFGSGFFIPYYAGIAFGYKF